MEKMSFWEAVLICLGKYATFRGRASRREFWFFTLFCLAFILLLLWVEPMMAVLFALAMYLPALAVAVRRLHDVGRSGWWVLLDITWIGSLVLLWWRVMPGDGEANAYGSPAQ